MRLVCRGTMFAPSWSTSGHWSKHAKTSETTTPAEGSQKSVGQNAKPVGRIVGSSPANRFELGNWPRATAGTAGRFAASAGRCSAGIARGMGQGEPSAVSRYARHHCYAPGFLARCFRDAASSADVVMSGRTLEVLQRLAGVYARRRDYWARESGFALAKTRRHNSRVWRENRAHHRGIARGFQDCLDVVRAEIRIISTLATGATHAGDSDPL